MTEGPDPAHVELVLARFAATVPRCGRVRVLAVDGPSGSGKSTLAGALAGRLKAPLVAMDELIPGWDGLAQASRLLDEQVLEPLARGERAAYRRYDWLAGAYAETVPVPVDDVLVVEGCGVATRPAGDRAALTVWVEAPRAVTMQRGLARDGDSFAPRWEAWKAQEDALYAADGTRDRADLVLVTG